MSVGVYGPVVKGPNDKLDLCEGETELVWKRVCANGGSCPLQNHKTQFRLFGHGATRPTSTRRLLTTCTVYCAD
eukprot:5037809-Prymnesium_polylepis.1